MEKMLLLRCGTQSLSYEWGKLCMTMLQDQHNSFLRALQAELSTSEGLPPNDNDMENIEKLLHELFGEDSFNLM